MAGENVTQWDRLPVTALEKIFSYLNPIDRSQAACVCKSWNEAYCSPSLWSAPVFKFNKSYFRFPRFNPRPTVQKYGAFFRKLTIICKRRPGIRKKFLAKQITNFLKEMVEHGVQLQSLRMPKWCNINQFHEVGHLCEQLTEFLQTQNALKNVDFTNAKALKLGGLKVLESLHPDNVEHLHLQNFFIDDSVLVLSEHRFLGAISRLHALRTLSVNYKYLSVMFLSTLARNLKGQLELLSILCVFQRGINYAIPEGSWSELMRECPALRVNFSLETFITRPDEIIERNIIPQFMRLEEFQFRHTDRWNDADYEMLDYVSRTFSSTLKNVVLAFQGDTETTVKQGVLNFVSRCDFLETLTLRANFCLFNFNDLFGAVHEVLAHQVHQNIPISLKEFRVTLRGLAIRERAIAVSLRPLYAPQFQMFGLKFKLIIKP